MYILIVIVERGGNIMKKFKFAVKDNYSQTYQGEIEAYNIRIAAEDIKELYAVKLDVENSEITIISIQEIAS